MAVGCALLRPFSIWKSPVARPLPFTLNATTPSVPALHHVLEEVHSWKCHPPPVPELGKTPPREGYFAAPVAFACR